MATSISSAPYMIDPTQFGLDDLHKNQARLASIKAKARKVTALAPFHGANLTEYEIGPDEAFIISEADEGEGDVIVYLVHLRMQYLKGLDSRSVTQVEVWRQMAHPVPDGLTAHVFFDILLKHFKYVVSDQSQTDRGKEFWLRRLAEANKRGLRIGVMLDDVVSWKGSDQIFSIWMRLQESESWGKKNIHYDTRFVIGR